MYETFITRFISLVPLKYNKYYNGLPWSVSTEKEKRVPVVNIFKDTRWLQEYVHIYKVSVPQDMIIKLHFIFEN